MTEIKANPSKTELRVFAVLLGVFAGVLGRVVITKPQSLLWAAAIAGVAWLVALVCQRKARAGEWPRGLVIPWMCLLFGGPSVRHPENAIVFAQLAWVAGGLLAVLCFCSMKSALLTYHRWMLAAEPLGWTFSHAFLAIAYYLVLTPIGLLLRLFGHDAMHRQIDPGATSYWIKRDPAPDSSRYFRQF